MMILPGYFQTTIGRLSELLKHITSDQYSNPCQSLSGATVGQHTRHIIELLNCLVSQYEAGIINYDLRERNLQMETDPVFANEQIKILITRINLPDKDLLLTGEFGNFKTNYQRELLYNLEHCIHHQALIKVALLENGGIIIPDDFGVAPSTLRHREKCVQ
jgi:hypothetical protein